MPWFLSRLQCVCVSLSLTVIFPVSGFRFHHWLMGRSNARWLFPKASNVRCRMPSFLCSYYLWFFSSLWMHVYMGVGILFQSRTEIIIFEGILNFMLKLTYGRTGKGGENIGHKSSHYIWWRRRGGTENYIPPICVGFSLVPQDSKVLVTLSSWAKSGSKNIGLPLRVHFISW